MSKESWDILTGDPEHDRGNVRALLESVTELYGTRTDESVRERAVDRAVSVASAQRGMLFLADEEGDLKPDVARDDGASVPLDMLYSKTVVDKVWSTGKPFRTMDTASAAPASLTDSMVALKLLSVMGVPLTVNEKRVGVLYVDSTARVREFTDADMAVFNALSGMVALAVENDRLLGEEQKKQRYEKELEVAQRIQTQLFPSVLPTIERAQIAAIGRPCEETSGDYYDVIATARGDIALVVGDVSGHGVGPAILTSTTRALLHSYLRMGMGLVEIVQNLNMSFVRDAPDDKFMTLFVATYDPHERVLQYVSAGHNPPVHWKRADSTFVELMPSGPALGILEDARYTLRMSEPLAPGDVVMGYTDGIVEARNDTREQWGEDAMMKVLIDQARADASAQHILDAILLALDTYMGETPWEDDVTGWVLRAE